MSSPDYIVAVDVETSGTIFPGTQKPGKKPSQAIEIAVCIVDRRTLKIVAAYESFIRFDGANFSWSDAAQKIHGIKAKSLRNAPTRAEVGEKVWQLIRKWLPRPTQGILLLAHNPGFDKAFLADLVAAAGHDLKFLHRMVDGFSNGFSAFGLHNTDHQFRYLGIYRDPSNHRAMDDIKMTIDMMRRVRAAGRAYEILRRHGKWGCVALMGTIFSTLLVIAAFL